MPKPDLNSEPSTAARKRVDARRTVVLAIVSSAAVIAASVLIVLSGLRF